MTRVLSADPNFPVVDRRMVGLRLPLINFLHESGLKNEVSIEKRVLEDWIKEIG